MLKSVLIACITLLLSLPLLAQVRTGKLVTSPYGLPSAEQPEPEDLKKADKDLQSLVSLLSAPQSGCGLISLTKKNIVEEESIVSLRTKLLIRSMARDADENACRAEDEKFLDCIDNSQTRTLTESIKNNPASRWYIMTFYQLGPEVAEKIISDMYDICRSKDKVSP